jgi:hypothetical protein
VYGSEAANVLHSAKGWCGFVVLEISLALVLRVKEDYITGLAFRVIFLSQNKFDRSRFFQQAWRSRRSSRTEKQERLSPLFRYSLGRQG